MVKKIRRKVKKVAMKAALVSMELEDVSEENKEQKKKLNVDFEKEFEFLEWKRLQQAEEELEETPEGEIPFDLPDEDVPSSNTPNAPEELKKLYRSIAQKTHPDKIKDEYLNDIFKQAAEAIEEENWMLLVELAGELRLDIEFLSDETLEIIEQSIQRNEQQIAGIKNSFSYIWSKQRDDKSREIFKSMFYQQFQIKEEEFNKWLNSTS
jgi:hypothetical protein